VRRDVGRLSVMREILERSCFGLCGLSGERGGRGVIGNGCHEGGKKVARGFAKHGDGETNPHTYAAPGERPVVLGGRLRVC